MIEIAIARPSDLESINKIRLAVTADHSSDHNLSEIEQLEIEHNEDRITFICEQNSYLIGYLTIYKMKSFDEKRNFMLEIFVYPDHQGQGAGTRLIETCLEHVSQSTNFERITLGVLHSNRSAIALYERFGFEILREDAKGKYMAREIQH